MQSKPQLKQLSPEMYSFEAHKTQIDSPSSYLIGQVRHVSKLAQVAHDSWQLAHCFVTVSKY